MEVRNLNDPEPSVAGKTCQVTEASSSNTQNEQALQTYLLVS